MAIVMENIKRLLDERANAWETEGKPLADIAATRDFTGEEKEKFERASVSFDSYSQRIKALELDAEQERAVQQFAEQLRSEPDVRRAFETELRSIFITREKPGYDFTFDGKDMKRALSAGGATAGGNTVAPQFLAELIQPLRNFASVLAAGARIITTETGSEITVPRTSSFGAAALQTENTQLTGTDPAFDQVTFGAYKFGDFRGVSRELFEDSAVDIESLIIEWIAENIGLLLGQKIAVGSGSGETAGLFTAATVGKTGATGVSGAFTFDDIIDTMYSVSAPYRVKGSFIMSDLAIAGARKLKDSYGQYLWSPSTQVGQPDLILGKPLYTDAFLASPALGAKPFGFGDVSRYWVRFVNSIRVERSDQALFGTDQIAYRGVLRADGGLTDASAFKVFRGGAS
jgi:HK97 family phage major capsid protein